MKFNFTACAAALAMAMISGSATAGIVQVADQAAMTQGTYSLETFESGAFVIPGVTYSAVGGVLIADQSVYAGPATPGNNKGLSTNQYPRPLTFTFAAPASSVGMYFGNDDRCCSQGFTAYMDIYGVEGLLGTISVVANMNDAADQYLGFISDQLVTSATVRFGNGNDVGLYHYVDNVMFNEASTDVPEPASALLLAMGLGGLALQRRRRAQR